MGRETVYAGDAMPIIRQAGDLQRLISEGESETTEFKVRTPPERALAAELAAFANSQGGTLIIGVDDHGKILGLDSSEATAAVERLRRVSTSLLPFSVDVGST